MFKRDIFLSNLKIETECVLRCQIDLNREMLRLPMSARRRSWKDYYMRLNDLMNRLDQIDKVAAFGKSISRPQRYRNYYVRCPTREVKLVE